jgi:hypothetical protein
MKQLVLAATLVAVLMLAAACGGGDEPETVGSDQIGWSGGRELVGRSYADAKVKVAEQKAERAARKAEKRAARAGGEGES